MRVRIDAPTLMEITDPKINERGIEFSPVVVKGQHILRLGYVQAIGDNGVTSAAVILFNGNTGHLSIQRTDKPSAKLPFDKPPGDFNARVVQARERGQRMHLPVPGTQET